MTDDLRAERATRFLRYLGPDPASWVRSTGTDHDVLVVGGGQAGLAVGFGLRRAGIAHTSVIDAAAPGGTGVWTTIARMRHLRTPKQWPEPELGFPELSFRAWYEDTHGPAAYDEIGRIPRLVWAEYVAWLEQALAVPVRHHTRLVSVEPATDHLVVRLDVDGVAVTETTRSLVLANGVEGTGGPHLPDFLRGLPASLVAHTGDRIDFTALAGRVVGVLGGGASALDTCGTALEAGAREVHLFVRRPDLIVQGPGAVHGAGLGARENFHRLPDADRWRAKALLGRAGRSCTLESVQRAAAHPGFRVHLDAGWHDAAVDGGRLRVTAADGEHLLDFAIAGTGYQYDPRTRPDLARIADRIALWGDAYTPPADLVDPGLARFPYLGDGYELTAKDPVDAGWVSRIRVFSAAAGLSFGLPVGDTQSLPTGVPRLVDAVARDLYLEDRATPQQAAPPAAASGAAPHRDAYAHAIWSGDPDAELV